MSRAEITLRTAITSRAAITSQAAITSRATRGVWPLLVCAVLLFWAPAAFADEGQDALPAGTALEAEIAPLNDAERQLLWRAGSGSIAGLSAARRSERAADKQAAVRDLQELLGSGSDRRELVLAEVESLLQDPSQEATWCVGARVVGVARAYDLAPILAAALEEESSSPKLHAAREGLRSLFGRWFDTPEEVAPFLREVQPGPGTNLLVASALAADDLAVTEQLRRLELLREDPRRLLTDTGALNQARFDGIERYMDADDPRIRHGAAQLIAAVARETQDVAVGGKLWQSLAARVTTELDPLVFEEVVGLLVDEFSTRAVAEEQLIRLRAELLSLAVAVEPRRALAVAEALARLPWEPTSSEPQDPAAEGEADLGDVLSTLGKLLERLLDGQARGGFVEPEIVVGTISAAQLLVSKVEPAVLLGEEGVADLRAPLEAVIVKSSRQEVGVRITALIPYARIARGTDAALLLRQIGDEQTPPTYAHALLGALGDRFFAAENDDTGSGRIFVTQVAALLEKTTDADLQKRALSLLADDRLAVLMDSTFTRSNGTESEEPEGTEPQIDPNPIDAAASKRLARSLLGILGAPGTQPEQRAQALRLFGRVAGIEFLGLFLELPTFDLMVSAGPTELGEIANILQKVAAGDPKSLFDVARRLVNVQDGKTIISRARRALAMVAALDTQSAAKFEPAEDSEVCNWVLELSAAGLALEELVPDFAAFRDRLLQVHLPDAEQGGTLEPWRLSHLRALLLASRVLEGTEGADVAEVDAAYDFALTGAEGQVRVFVLRDRARWRMARDTPKRALADYTQLRESDVLQISDIRAALSALDRGASTERVGWLRSLVERENWSLEATAVRFEDLQAYVDGVLALPPTTRAEFLPKLTEFFSTLPEVSAEAETQAVSVRWQALVKVPAGLVRLDELRRQVREATALPPELVDVPGTQEAGGDDADGEEDTEPVPAPKQEPADGPGEGDAGGADEGGGS